MKNILYLLYYYAVLHSGHKRIVSIPFLKKQP